MSESQFECQLGSSAFLFFFFLIYKFLIAKYANHHPSLQQVTL